jgi:hypothetical protein
MGGCVSSEIIVFVFGCLLLLIAILGGGFEVKELKIGKVGQFARAGCSLLGLLFVALGIWLHSSSIPGPEKGPLPNNTVSPTPIQNTSGGVTISSSSTPPNPKKTQKKSTASSAPIPVRGDIIIGTWQQYGLDATTSRWELFGTFVVVKVGGVYTISAREQRDAPGLLHSIGIFDVRSDGVSWTFNSNWGGGRVGNFRLHRVSDTQFDGTVYFSGRAIGITRWIRIQ